MWITPGGVSLNSGPSFCIGHWGPLLNANKAQICPSPTAWLWLVSVSHWCRDQQMCNSYYAGEVVTLWGGFSDWNESFLRHPTHKCVVPQMGIFFMILTNHNTDSRLKMFLMCVWLAFFLESNVVSPHVIHLFQCFIGCSVSNYTAQCFVFR